MEYSYPFSSDWTTEEVVDVIQFFETIEKVYERGVKRNELMSKYRRFKEIVPSIAEEKKLSKEFEEVSGYSTYHAIKKMKEAAEDDVIKVKGK
ncbi:MAG TPA: UPF0223 family protein [Chondromyces sp.]|nr:UPF0223 family protein [Chondromyces sp.]